MDRLKRFWQAVIETYHRVIGVTQQEHSALQEEHARLEARLKEELRKLAVASSVEIERLKEEVTELKAELSKQHEQHEQQVAGLEAAVSVALGELTTCVRYLHCTKRDTPGLRGDAPASLKG